MPRIKTVIEDKNKTTTIKEEDDCITLGVYEKKMTPNFIGAIQNGTKITATKNKITFQVL